MHFVCLRINQPIEKEKERSSTKRYLYIIHDNISNSFIPNISNCPFVGPDAEGLFCQSHRAEKVYLVMSETSMRESKMVTFHQRFPDAQTLTIN